MPRVKAILCPIDFDAGSLSALRLATEQAQTHKAVLHLLHVVDIPTNIEVPLPLLDMETRAEAKLALIARRRVGAKARYRVHVAVGDPARQVLFTARQLRAMLIVMATHGRKGLRRVLLGSVAERVVREAPCPVLTVRPRGSRVRRSGR